MNKLEGGINCPQTIIAEEKITSYKARTVACWQQKHVGCGLAQFQPASGPGHSHSGGVSQCKILSQLWEGENIRSASKITFLFIRPFPIQMP